MPSQGWSQALISAQGDGPTITAASLSSLLPNAAVYTLPANTLQIGSVLRIKAAGRVSTVITTPGTFRFEVLLGGTQCFDSLAILPDSSVAYTTVGWDLEILLTCRAIGNGTNANFFGQGKFTCTDLAGQPATAPKGALTAILPWNSAPAVGAGFNSTQNNTVDLQFLQTVTTGSITLHQYVLESLN